MWESLDGAERVLASARKHAVPLPYIVGGAANPVYRLQQRQHKHPGAIEQPADAGTVVEQIRPAQGDIVLPKTKPSAFVGTSLLSMLHSILVYAQVDCMVLTGGTTSGCVRAIATEAFSNGFSAIVVEDATFDRAALSHAVGLFDLNQKYADVRSSREMVQYFATLAGA